MIFSASSLCSLILLPFSILIVNRLPERAPSYTRVHFNVHLLVNSQLFYSSCDFPFHFYATSSVYFLKCDSCKDVCLPELRNIQSWSFLRSLNDFVWCLVF